MRQHITTLARQLDSFGKLLKQWRDRRNFIQLDLAFNYSSFIFTETIWS